MAATKRIQKQIANFRWIDNDIEFTTC